MKPKTSQSRRRATRLRGYDYGQTGGYFVTICAQDQECLFGEIIDGRMQLNDIGKIVVECWNRIPQHFYTIGLDVNVVMPNHVHGVVLSGIGGSKSDCAPTLGQVAGYFKYQSTKYINQHRDMPGTRIWQRNYYDHVLRDDMDFERIRQYIVNNPMQWELDQLHPNNFAR